MGRRRVAAIACAALFGVALGIPVGRHFATDAPTSGPTLATGYAIVRDDSAPGLAGRTLDGQAFDLADRHGHVVLLGVWATWCPPCADELRLLAEASVRWSAHGVRVITLNVRDDADAARSLLAQTGATDLPTVSDPDGTVALAWGVYGLPQTFLLDQTGRIRLQRFGPVTAAWLDAEIRSLLPS